MSPPALSAQRTSVPQSSVCVELTAVDQGWDAVMVTTAVCGSAAQGALWDVSVDRSLVSSPLFLPLFLSPSPPVLFPFSPLFLPPFFNPFLPSFLSSFLLSFCVGDKLRGSLMLSKCSISAPHASPGSQCRDTGL